MELALLRVVWTLVTGDGSMLLRPMIDLSDRDKPEEVVEVVLLEESCLDANSDGWGLFLGKRGGRFRKRGMVERLVDWRN